MELFWENIKRNKKSLKNLSRVESVNNFNEKKITIYGRKKLKNKLYGKCIVWYIIQVSIFD